MPTRKNILLVFGYVNWVLLLLDYPNGPPEKHFSVCERSSQEQRIHRFFRQRPVCYTVVDILEFSKELLEIEANAIQLSKPRIVWNEKTTISQAHHSLFKTFSQVDDKKPLQFYLLA